MSGYQGKKNIPRITVSFFGGGGGGVVQTLGRFWSCPTSAPGPGGRPRGGGDHAPRPHPPLRSLSSELKELQLTEQLFFVYY